MSGCFDIGKIKHRFNLDPFPAAVKTQLMEQTFAAAQMNMCFDLIMPDLLEEKEDFLACAQADRKKEIEDFFEELEQRVKHNEKFLEGKTDDT